MQQGDQVVKRRRKSKQKEVYTRPYRLRLGNQDLPHRYYVHSKRAHMGALIECKWSRPETVIEVYNINTGALLGQYKRMLSSVVFMR